MPFGGQGAAHPHIHILGQQVAIVWQEFDGTNNRVQLLKSNDSGKTWSQVETVLQTTDAIDSPFLLSDGKNLYLSAQVTQQDYRLQKINF